MATTIAADEHLIMARRARRFTNTPLPLLAVGVLVGASMLLPLAYLLIRAAASGDSIWRLLFRARTLTVLLHTVGLASAVTLATVLLAVPLAWLTVRTDLPLRRLWAVLLTLPLAVPSYVGAFVLVAALGPRGMLHSFLSTWLGVERLPEIYGFPGAWLALTLLTYPYVFLSVRAGLAGMAPHLEEASRSLGQSPWSTFLRVTLPQLRPSITAGGLLVALYTLSDFGAVSLLRFDSFTRAIYLQYQGSFDRHLAAGLALVLVLITLSVLLLEGWSRGQARYYTHARSGKRPLQVVPLGPWRWPAVLFCAGVVALAIGLPVLVVIYWLVKGLGRLEALSTLPLLARNSFLVSLVTALVAFLLAAPVAYLTVRYRSAATRALEYAIYLGYALPGIVVALSLVFFGARVVPLVYQTFFLLVFAYVVRYLPQAYGSLASALLRVHPSLEEAARCLGRTWPAAFATITLPLISRGAIAGATLVFIATIKELPITLLLGPIGFKTLATSIWSATSESFYAQAALLILVLLAISALPTLLFETRDT